MDFLSMSQDSIVTCLSISAKVGTLVTPQADFSSMATYHPAIGSTFYINWTCFYFTISSFCQLLKQQLYCKHTADKISISLHHHTTDTPLQGSWFCWSGALATLSSSSPICLWSGLYMNVECVMEAVSCCREVILYHVPCTLPIYWLLIPHSIPQLQPSYWHIHMLDFSPIFEIFLLPKAFSMSKCAYMHVHSCPMICELNLHTSSRDTCLCSTIESMIIGG